jgi:hypothetical protein
MSGIFVTVMESYRTVKVNSECKHQRMLFFSLFWEFAGGLIRLDMRHTAGCTREPNLVKEGPGQSPAIPHQGALLLLCTMCPKKSPRSGLHSSLHYSLVPNQMCFIHMYTHFLQTNLLIHTEPLGVVQE